MRLTTLSAVVVEPALEAGRQGDRVPLGAPCRGDAATETPRSQVWLLPLSGGEPRRVTNLLNGVSSFQWSPDGTRLVVRQPQRSERHREVAERRAALQAR